MGDVRGERGIPFDSIVLTHSWTTFGTSSSSSMSRVVRSTPNTAGEMIINTAVAAPAGGPEGLGPPPSSSYGTPLLPLPPPKTVFNLQYVKRLQHLAVIASVIKLLMCSLVCTIWIKRLLNLTYHAHFSAPYLLGPSLRKMLGPTLYRCT